jgi:hypothetical protein
MIAKEQEQLPTLHYTSKVGGESHSLLRNEDMDLVGEIDASEQLIEGSGRSGDRSEDGLRGSTCPRVAGHSGCGFRSDEYVEVKSQLCTGHPGSEERGVERGSSRVVSRVQGRLGRSRERKERVLGLGILDVDADRAEHVDRAEPAHLLEMV